MTLLDKIQLIDALIREHPDHTIRDYIEVLEEVATIAKSNAMPYPSIGEDKRREILTLAATMTVKEIRMRLCLSFVTIYKVLNNENFDYQEVAFQRKRQKREQLAAEQKAIKEKADAERLELIRARQLKYADPKPEPFVRPAAEYSNHSPWNIASAYNNQTTTP